MEVSSFQRGHDRCMYVCLLVYVVLRCVCVCVCVYLASSLCVHVYIFVYYLVHVTLLPYPHNIVRRYVHTCTIYIHG